MRPPCNSISRLESASPSPVPSRSSAPNFGLLELLEDSLLVLGRDPGAGVRNGDEHFAVSLGRADDDAPSLRGELDRVREQVEHDLADAALVCFDDFYVGICLERELHAVFDRTLPEHDHAALKCFTE